MIALCVDDEPILLKALQRAVEKSPDITETFTFEDELDAMMWIREHPCDIAFLDIELHAISGLELAQRMRKVRPGLAIVFCTAYPQYAVQTIGMHIDCGYLLKPVQAKDVQAEIDHILQPLRKPLRVVCFGSFEAFVNDKPLDFRRKKTRELLAYLVDRKGAFASANEICAVLWENAPDDTRSRDYFYHLLSDLKRALEKEHASSVLLTSSSGYGLDTSQVDCDYYRLLAGDEQAIQAFNGEYMNRYSWSEPTAAWLQRKVLSSKNI